MAIIIGGVAVSDHPSDEDDMLKALFITIWVMTLSLMVGLPAPAVASSSAYSFALIADTRGPLESISPSVSINNAGTVALGASLRTGGGGVFVGNGGGVLHTIARGEHTGFGATINDAGTVAFLGESAEGRMGMFASNGRSTTTIALGDIFGMPRINNKGAVVFLKLTLPIGDPSDGILVGSGGPLTRISSRGEGGFINDQGTVVFVMQSESGIQGVYLGKGGRPTLAAAAVPQGPFAGFSVSPVINNGDAIAFTAFLNIGGSGVFKICGGSLTTIANSFGPFSRFDYVAMNDSGAVVFDADLKVGGRGIFTGVDPVKNKIIATGDPLFGSRVKELLLFREGLNNRNQVAFHAVLEDGRQAIVRATPSYAPVP